MILEALVSTTNPDGTARVAPMGPHVEPNMTQFTLRPFPTSRTYQNLLKHGEGVLHVTDDALLLAKAAVGVADSRQKMRAAEFVRGYVLTNCCRYFEFRVRSVEATEPRVTVVADVIHVGTLRDFWGFNRGKHSVLEAAILSTRLHLLPSEDVAAEFQKLRVIVEKTGGPDELEAMASLDEYRVKFHHELAAISNGGSAE